jgi:hypothetical protein
MDDRRLLVEALVGMKHRNLYLNSATFHAHIEMAARMLTIMVDALAVAAAEEKKRTADMIRIMESTAMRNIQVTAEDVRRWEGLANPLVDP